MPTFNPNIAKTAKANVTVKPAGLSYKCELYLVKDTTKYNTSGLISFTSTGAAQPASFPITMPSAGGTYKVWLDVFSDSILIGAFRATEGVTITLPPEANFSIEITGASKMNPAVGEYISIYYRVTNIGDVAARYGHIDYVNGTPFASVPLIGEIVEPGSSIERAIRTSRTVPGTRTYQIAVTTCSNPSGAGCGRDWVITGYSNTITITWG